MTDRLGELFIAIAENFVRKLGGDDECSSAAILRLCERWQRFDLSFAPSVLFAFACSNCRFAMQELRYKEKRAVAFSQMPEFSAEFSENDFCTAGYIEQQNREFVVEPAEQTDEPIKFPESFYIWQVARDSRSAAERIGSKVVKKDGKPFKSGLQAHTVKAVVVHPTGDPAFTFHEDDSVILARCCRPIERRGVGYKRSGVAQFIRELSEADPNRSNSEIKAILATRGIRVSIQHVAQEKRREKRRRCLATATN